MTKIYESGVAGAFMYMWGYHDAKAGVASFPGLLLNAQSPLDHLIGDLFGAVSPTAGLGRRWFIAELKQRFQGFRAEVHWARAKPHRIALYQHLRLDQPCQRLSDLGHMAVWHQPEGIVIAPYARAVGPGKAGGPGPGWQTLDYQSFTLAFDQFYGGLHEADLTLFRESPDMYAHGLGLPATGMRKYLECMLQFCLPIPATAAQVSSVTSNLLFGHVGPVGGANIVATSFSGLLSACAAFIQAVTPPHPRPSGPR